MGKVEVSTRGSVCSFRCVSCEPPPHDNPLMLRNLRASRLVPTTWAPTHAWPTS